MDDCYFKGHKFELSPFYALVAVSFEEPQYYPPQGMIRLECCENCGAIRIPKKYIRVGGENLTKCKISEPQKESEKNGTN